MRPTRSLGAVSRLSPRSKLFKTVVKHRVFSGEPSSDPPVEKGKPPFVPVLYPPRPIRGALFDTQQGLRLHWQYKHPSEYKEGFSQQACAALPIRCKSSGNAPGPQKKTGPIPEFR